MENEEKKEEVIVNEQGEIVLADNSEIKIADEVVAVIAEVLSGKKNLAKGIKVEAGEKETKIDVNIIVEYGVRIPDVAFEIQYRVKKAVETMTGLSVVEVNVHVQGVNTDAKMNTEGNETQE